MAASLNFVREFTLTVDAGHALEIIIDGAVLVENELVRVLIRNVIFFKMQVHITGGAASSTQVRSDILSALVADVIGAAKA
jgi:hypothetical protein